MHTPTALDRCRNSPTYRIVDTHRASGETPARLTPLHGAQPVSHILQPVSRRYVPSIVCCAGKPTIGPRGRFPKRMNRPERCNGARRRGKIPPAGGAFHTSPLRSFPLASLRVPAPPVPMAGDIARWPVRMLFSQPVTTDWASFVGVILGLIGAPTTASNRAPL